MASLSAALQVAWCCAQTGAALIAGAAHLCCCARGARASSDVVWSAPAQFVASRSRPEQRSVHTAHPAMLAGANALSISQCQGEPVHRRVKARSVVRQGHSRAHADKRRRRIIQHPPHACSPVAQMPKHFDKRALTRCGYRENPTARILAAWSSSSFPPERVLLHAPDATLNSKVSQVSLMPAARRAPIDRWPMLPALT